MAAVVDEDEQCPSCLTKKSASPNLRFKINTKCYHRICESCVDRTYATGGQHTCPHPKCTNTFWKNAWRTQTFDDLKVEKEINIRKDIYSTLSREEGEFVDKRAYDDFLELRELFIMNLLLNTDAASTRRKLNDYREANGLARLKDDISIKSKARPAKKVDPDYPDKSGLIEGLKRIVAPEALPPFNPFEGLPTTKDYFNMRAGMDTGYEQYKKDEMMPIEGYDLRDTLEESLSRAFAGLGVFIQDEKSRSTDVAVAADSNYVF